MMTAATKSLLGGVLAAGLMLDKAPSPAAQTPASGHTVTDAEYQRWKTDLSNWGRWGKSDEIGALNLITPAKRKQAAALVRRACRYRSRPMRTACRRWTIRTRTKS